MTKAEIATYLGMANVMMASATDNLDDDEQGKEMMVKVREALLSAQLILTQQAIEEAYHDTE